MIRRIVQIGVDQLHDGVAPEGNILSKKCAEIVDFDDALSQLVHDLIDTLFAHPIAIGLAAPQIDVDAQVAVVNVERADPTLSLVLINPLIQSESGKKDEKRESCMSLPGVAGPVIRRTRVQVQCDDVQGLRSSHGYQGFLARVVQHEVDHLNGLLYSARMEDPQRFEATDIFDYQGPKVDGG